jgi:hypothetical protein
MKLEELLRLACIYAERDQLALLDAHRLCNSPGDKRFKKGIANFIKQLRRYRIKRWGLTALETFIKEADEKTIGEIIKEGLADAK